MNQSADVLVRLCVNQALVLAGKRRRNRENYRELRAVPVAHTHTKLGPVPADDVPRLIDGWDDILDPTAVTEAGVDTARLATTVRILAGQALRTGKAPTFPHDVVRKALA